MEDCSIETALHRQAIVIGDTVDSSNIWGSPFRKDAWMYLWENDITSTKLGAKAGFARKKIKSGGRKSTVDGSKRSIYCIIVDTPWKINMEHNHGGLEDHFPFFLWVMAVGEPAVNLPGCR